MKKYKRNGVLWRSKYWWSQTWEENLMRRKVGDVYRNQCVSAQSAFWEVEKQEKHIQYMKWQEGQLTEEHCTIISHPTEMVSGRLIHRMRRSSERMPKTKTIDRPVTLRRWENGNELTEKEKPLNSHFPFVFSSNGKVLHLNNSCTQEAWRRPHGKGSMR